MAEDPCTLSPQVLALRIAELDRRVSLHVTYQAEAAVKEAAVLDERLRGMNEFREALREQTGQLVTVRTFQEHVGRSDQRALDSHRWVEERILREEAKLDQIEKSITPGLGARVMALEIARSNMEGRFWALTAVIVVVQIALQLWPLLRAGH